MLLKILIGRIVARSTRKGDAMAVIEGQSEHEYLKAIAFGDVAEFYLANHRDGDSIEVLGEWSERERNDGSIERNFKIDRLPYEEEKKRLKKRKASVESIPRGESLLAALPTYTKKGLCIVFNKNRQSYSVERLEYCVEIGKVKVCGKEIENHQSKIDFVLERLGAEAVIEALREIGAKARVGTEDTGILNWHKVCAPGVSQEYRAKLDEMVALAQTPLQEEVTFNG